MYYAIDSSEGKHKTDKLPHFYFRQNIYLSSDVSDVIFLFVLYIQKSTSGMRAYQCVHVDVCEDISMWLNHSKSFVYIFWWYYGENFAWKIIIPNLDLLY